MAKLNFDERKLLERVLSLENGYVLDLKNRTFSDFKDAIGIDAYSANYEKYGTSKAELLRCLIEDESDVAVSNLLLALLAGKGNYRILTYIRSLLKASGTLRKV